MSTARLVICLVILMMTTAPDQVVRTQRGSKVLIAHRGASAYAPEHTTAAYRLAIVQQVDYVEQDLAVTKDGQLICLHDDTLERTTNVASVFPEIGRAHV